MLSHRIHLPLPAILSLLFWGVFAVYWDASAKNSSPSKKSESTRSRWLHVTLLNAAFLLSVVPIFGSRWPMPLGVKGAWIGIFVQSASLTLAVWARRHLAFNWSGEVTIKVDHMLVRTGPYGWVRHPIYTAILGMFLGSSLGSCLGLGVIGFIIAFYAYTRKIHVEEQFLQVAFGGDYEEYRRKTGALLPRLGKPAPILRKNRQS